jgi:CheY-like chemotaxis protein
VGDTRLATNLLVEVPQPLTHIHYRKIPEPSGQSHYFLELLSSFERHMPTKELDDGLVSNERIMNQHCHSSTSVLIVDDAPSARAVLKDMLEELGFGAIFEAADGREATAVLEQQTVDIVLCDQVMPDMSGKELLVHIRQTLGRDKLPVIFVSALSAVNEVEEVLELKATDYLVKPVSLRKLLRKLEDALLPPTERIELSPEQIRSLNNH